MSIAEFAQHWESAIATIAGVLIGAVIAGSSHLWKRRMERKEAFATALASLLEARHAAKTGIFVLGTLRRRMRVPVESGHLPHSVMDGMAPQTSDLHLRYDAAVTKLSTIDPLLAFELRSKDSLPQILRNARAEFAKHEVSPLAVESIERIILKAVMPSVDQALRLLAKNHSRKTLKNLDAYLASDESKLLRPILDQVFADLAVANASEVRPQEAAI